MNADERSERCSQMSMRVPTIVIQRQCWACSSALREILTPPEVLRVDRLCRSIARAVKK